MAGLDTETGVDFRLEEKRKFSVLVASVALTLAATCANGFAQVWGPIELGVCDKKDDKRQVSAELRNIPHGMNSTAACQNTPKNVMGYVFMHPERCSTDRILGFPIGERGVWKIPDSSCVKEPLRKPIEGGIGTLSSADPLEGYADIHVHQMGNLGFGGSIIWGRAFGEPDKVLGPIPREMQYGHDTAEMAVHEGLLSFVRGLFGILHIHDYTHGENGFPDFKSWPAHNRYTHQQVYEDWLFRAYQGGLRLMVMLAVNSEDMFSRGENQIPVVGGRVFGRVIQPARAPNRTSNDMEALEWQVRAAYELERKIDWDNDGPGNGWYRIVRDPVEAGKAIAKGQLAVILGTELQHLFNCDTDRPKCEKSTIVEGLNRLEAMGVNYVFPVHHKLNQFSGPAMFTVVNAGATEKCVEYEHECSNEGLTDLGKFLVEELTARGMLIDTEHLSRRAFEDLMRITEQRKYPVLASHVVPFDLQTKDIQQTERAKTSDQIRRILQGGGIVAAMLGTPAGEYVSSPQEKVRVPISCEQVEGGGVDEWTNAYLMIRSLAANGGLSGTAGRIAIGSDFNGFAGWPMPSPRHPCKPRKADIPEEDPVSYPFELPMKLVPAAIGPVKELDKFLWPPVYNSRYWDFNSTGLAHVGLEPDFLWNVRGLGLKLEELEPIYRSARGVVDLWERARDAEVPEDRHHLRWAPQHPFDVLEFPAKYWDDLRNVDGGTGFPICRTRLEHRLGFRRGDTCVLVEPETKPADQPSSISLYSNGRCLDIRNESVREGARVQQMRCGNQSSQLWIVLDLSSGSEIKNKQSGKCLTAPAKLESSRAEVVQATCFGNKNQIWTHKRVGNTFQLTPLDANLCLSVPDQNRKDGVAVRLVQCDRASDKLWSVESLRSHDYELLYQAEKGHTQWLVRSNLDYPIPVTVDDIRPICRSRADRWLGVVTGKMCVGRTYAGNPASTSDFEQLLQAR